MSLGLLRKHPHMDAYYVGGSYQPYAVIGRDKRFTDGELAAEYWLTSSHRERMFGYQDGVGSATRKQADRDAERMKVIHQFATKPHASETNYE